jgi:hypothetical protein
VAFTKVLTSNISYLNSPLTLLHFYILHFKIMLDTQQSGKHNRVLVYHSMLISDTIMAYESRHITINKINDLLDSILVSTDVLLLFHNLVRNSTLHLVDMFPQSSLDVQDFEVVLKNSKQLGCWVCFNLDLSDGPHD